MRSSAVVCVVVVLLLSGCAAAPVEPIVIEPPGALLSDCPVPLPERTAKNFILIGSAVAWAGALLASLRTCNADKQALRQFYEEVGSGPQ